MQRDPVEIPIAPVPKPRMTKSDRWKQRPAVMRYWQFKDDLKREVTGDLDARFSVVFHIAMPKSWPEKRKLLFDGKPHQVKPDADNYLKAFMDALCVDDSYVYDARVQKYWAREGKIILTEFGD